jgi:predicted Zn-dependent protease with MMP-like domain
MNDYFNTFFNLDESIEQLLKDEHNSLEIKESATSLKESIQPCIEELTQSAARLKKFVLVCSEELYHAEDVWLSKPRIAEAAPQEIWEQIGESSGCAFRIRNLAIQCKLEAVKNAKKYWEQAIEQLRQKWFVDVNGQSKKGVGWSDKEGFIKDIRQKFKSQNQKISPLVSNGLRLLSQEFYTLNLEITRELISIFDIKTKNILTHEIDYLLSKMEKIFNSAIDHLPNETKEFNNAIVLDLAALVNNGWGDIYWEDVVKFKNKVYIKIDDLIHSIFDDRVKLATEALEQAIAFYNDFLERQERYQQETPEQREAEKAWIDRQRQQLQQVQNGIEAILNAS